jgi:hypothetical protein
MAENIIVKNHDDAIRRNTWLQSHARNVTSQYGEDGIIEKILEVIGQRNKWCVEFGSWDGKRCSNTFRLITDGDYSGVLIEGDRRRFIDLEKTFEGKENVVLLNSYVGFEEKNSLDVILENVGVPQDFDLLSIDIDGNDYHVWDAVQNYKPKVVVIEFNPTIPKTVEFVQARDLQISQGSSLLSIDKLAKSKGYELVCTTKANAFFVDLKYFNLFGIKDNSVEVMMTDESLITHIFCGYDGTVFIRGFGVMPWQAITYKESRVQQLPKWARKKIGDRNILRRKLGRWFRRLRKNGKI